jgi:hypothetical protein
MKGGKWVADRTYIFDLETEETIRPPVVEPQTVAAVGASE